MDFPSFITQYKTYCTELDRDRDTKLDTNGFCISVHVYMLYWLGVGEGLLERAKRKGMGFNLPWPQNHMSMTWE